MTRLTFASTAAAVLLAALALQGVRGARALSPTFDEHSHLPAGYSYWQTGDLRLNPQHPPLVKLLCAAPLLLLRPNVSWMDESWASANEWRFGHVFLYESGNDVDRLLFWGRMPVVVLSVLLGVYVYVWSKARFGPAAGIAGLVLYAFCPTVVAHSRFVTMDVPLAAFVTACLFHLWRYRGLGRRRDLVCCGVLLGAALAAKFSGLVLAPIVVAALLLPPRRRAVRDVLVVAALAVAVVWAAYFFTSDVGAYARGLSRVNQDRPEDETYFLLGEFRAGGWWYYFVVAFLLKTPLPALAAAAAGFVVAWRTGTLRQADDLLLLAPAAAFFLTTSPLADDIGVRYLLPVLPLLYVFASRIGVSFASSPAGRAALLGLGLWHAGGTLRLGLDEIAFFNEAAGGPAHGYRLLDDSNIDWGQDLKRLKAYADAHGIDSMGLCYPMKGYPPYYGLQAEPFPIMAMVPDPPAGDYVVSAQCLARVREFNTAAGRELDWRARFTPFGRVGSFHVFRFPQR